MAAKTTARPSARERLLAAADELFYDEGVRTVGIDRIIEHAGVAKASLYNTFGSKDELIHAYLEGRHARNAKRITDYIARYDTPRERLLGVFDAQGELLRQSTFHGCAFANATAEAHPGDRTQQAADAYRAWMRALFTDLAEQSGAADPATLGRTLHMLYDGSTQSGRMDRDPTSAAVARAAAEVLVNAAVASD
jgi:AcrR family transcriptional regulator